MRLLLSTMLIGVGLLWGAFAQADPCGMVPPIAVAQQITGPAIERTGAQRTYVMFKDGVETIALRPGFVGKVEEFGMLIPFPSPPELRKIDDDTFAHIEAAIDPPTVHVRVYEPMVMKFSSANRSGQGGMPIEEREAGLELDKDEVRVLKEEAVGMYQVAVLEAGSAKALQRWMTDNGYKYPEGMDDVAEDYVDIGWAFVAIKTQVGRAAGVTPKPGMRTADPSLNPGQSFDGHVQGMGFRFKVKQAVVPMRLSVFNGGDARNVVYMLTDKPVRIDDISEELVLRQLDGGELHANMTQPLDLIFDEGKASMLGPYGKQQVEDSRKVEPLVRAAKQLFASDLVAISSGKLSLPFEEEEKELLRISEALGLRGAEIDRMHGEQLDEMRSKSMDSALASLDRLTLSVIDGAYSTEVLSRQNLTFSEYRLPAQRNKARTDNIRPPDIYLELYNGQ